MTVCIAALCNDDHLVAVFDRMITVGGISEYEPRLSKATALPTHNIFILVAGDMSFHEEVLAELRPTVMPTETDINSLNVVEVARLYKELANRIYLEREQEPILRRYKLTPETFISRQSEMSHAFIDRVMDELDKIDPPPVSALILGYDQRKRAQIFRFSNGRLTLETATGFAAIGNGEWHAETQLHDCGFTKGCLLVDGLFYCYASKKRAELAPGVGTQTRIIYINREGYHNLDPFSERDLETIFRQLQRELLEIDVKISKEWRERFNSNQQEAAKIRVEIIEE